MTRLLVVSKFLLLLGIFDKFSERQHQLNNSFEDVNLTKARKVPLYTELSAALPLVIRNLSNYSGLIHDKGAPPNPNITYHFGELEKDLALLSDKVSGFYAVLHEMLPDGSGPFLCPLNKQSHIKECLLIATCLLEYHVPEEIELAAFTTYMEMTQRFIDVGWTVLKTGLLMEEPTPILNMDAVPPEKYQCDMLKHEKVTGSSPSMLQVGSSESEFESDGATLAMSSALVHASKVSFQILDSHQVGSSVDATILKLHELWMPICKHLNCDHSNFWDLHYASYQQTASLLELKSGYAARRAMRHEVQHRVKLEKRFIDFVSENHEYYSRLYNGTSSDGSHFPPGRRFVDSNFIQTSSRAARLSLLGQGRESMVGHMKDFAKEISTEEESRAIRLFDHVEYRKFQRDRHGHRQVSPVSLLQDEENEVEENEENEEQENSEEDMEDMEDEDEDEDDEDKEVAIDDEDAVSKDGDDVPALVEEDSVLEDSTEDDKGSRRRRRRRSRRRARRRWIGGRRRRRRRRRIFDVVASVVEDVGAFMEALTGCMGYAIEFASTGYDYEVVPGAVSMSLGLSAGVRQALEDLISKRPPSFSISLDFGFAVGVTKKLVWTGLGLGGSLTCSVGAACEAYITVAVLGSVNVPTQNAACPMGATWGAATCAQSFGGGISAMCCSMGLQRGSNDCR